MSLIGLIIDTAFVLTNRPVVLRGLTISLVNIKKEEKHQIFIAHLNFVYGDAGGI